VDIILTNNGYTVVNLGIRAVNIVGRAGGCDRWRLLVKSTLVMRDSLEELNARDLWRFQSSGRRPDAAM
jgi:5-methyltetrahydrofolate--homocysteine methyltransferase